MKSTSIRGLLAAPFTPFDDDGTLAIGRVPTLVAHLAGSGIRGMFINGSTGEGASLTETERRATAETYVTVGKEYGVVSIVHVGHDSLPTACAFAAHAEEIEADAIGVIPTSYFKLASIHSLVGYLSSIAASAPGLPLYYYHIPRLTGSDFDMLELLRCAGRELPTLAGIKYSSSDLSTFAECKAFDGGRYNMLFGVDEMLLAGLAMGADGAVGSTYNFMAPLYLKIMSDFEAGDHASALAHQTKAAELIRAIVGTAGMPGLKIAMGLAGHDCGPLRAPLHTPSPGIIEEMRNRLEGAGFFEWIEASATP